MKRTFDLVSAWLGLLVLAPVLGVIALAVRLDSRGPVFFRQVRIGRGFRPFRIFKFRTMVAGATGPLVTSEHDGRVTRVGRMLRATKLDELPQLFNVILGDMSLIGPRPEVAHYVEMFRSDYSLILTVRPGISDLASVAFRHEAQLLSSFQDPERAYVDRILPTKIALAKEYLERRSLRLDLLIIADTLRKVLRGSGTRRPSTRPLSDWNNRPEARSRRLAEPLRRVDGI